MTVTVEFPPDVEARLVEEAGRRRLSVADFVRDLVATGLPTGPRPPFFKTATPEEWKQVFHDWVESHHGAPTLPPEAFERESMYEGRC
jgi:hypothetical protein